MRLQRAGPKRPIASDWVTAGDITATGTSTQESANMDLDLSGLPAYVDWHVEVEFTHQRTGGSGVVYTWVKGQRFTDEFGTTDNADPDTNYTRRLQAAGTARDRRVIIKSHVLSPNNSSLDSLVQFTVRASGSAADSDISVTNIRARVVYTPL